MIVSEDRAKELIACRGVQTPRGQVARTPAEAAAIAHKLGGGGVVKALIPAGGRDKAGGVKVCSSIVSVREAASALLDRQLLGHTVRTVLVEQIMPIDHELYAGVVVNSVTGMIDLVVSLAGGVDIEHTAHRDSQSVMCLAVEPGHVLPVHQVRAWLRLANVQLVDPDVLADVLVRLYRTAADLDALLLEVNPLAVLRDGSIVSLDCKLDVDDNGLARQPELAELYRATLSTRELRARELGVSFVPLDGDIAVIASGAGLGMATLDMLKRNGLAPATFLDTGGGISEVMVKGALELVMEPLQVRGAIINLYGGINSMLAAAQGIKAALKNLGGNRPIVVKVLGNQQEEAWAMLDSEPNVHLIRVVQTEAAVARLAELMR